jgi:uncharacterized repeat protein (TIGR01451 family)
MRNLALFISLLPLGVQAITIVDNFVLNPTCTSNNGSIDIEVYNGVQPITYSWSNGSTMQDLTGLPPGTYTVTVSDVNGATAERTFTLTAEPELNLGGFSFVLNDVPRFPCPGTNDGIAVIPLYPTAGMNPWSGVNGVPPYNVTFLIGGSPVAPGGTDNAGNPWYPGLYSSAIIDLTVTDAAGCSYAQPGLPVGGPPLVGAQVAEIVDACAGGANGSVVFTPHPEFLGWLGRLQIHNDQGQVVAYTEPFVDPPSATGLLPGDYTVSTTYGQGPELTCTGQYLDPFTIGDMGPDCGVLGGTLFIDNDQDCTQDAGEVGLPYRVLEIQPGPHYAITDQNGVYQRNLGNGSYTLAVQGPDLVPLCPATMPVPFTVANSNVNLDLADSSTVPLDLYAHCWALGARPGFAHQVWLTAVNTSAQLSGPLTATFTFDGQMDFVSAIPAPTTINGNVLSWSASALNAYGGFSAHVVLQVPADVALLGEPFAHTFTVAQPLPESDAANNTAVFNGTITGAYDPNDKTAYTSTRASETSFIIDQDEHIDYRIRFQNTGTDTAFTVVITDTISPLLDLSTFAQGPASHPFSVRFKGDRVVEWTFADILLPDSNVNEAASQGMVTFRIRPILPLLAGTELTNHADIFFDFNPPVRTNDAVLVAEFSTGVATTAPEALALYPNPVHDVLQLPCATPAGMLRIVAPDGRVVLQQRAARTVDVQHLAPGPYIVSLTSNTGTIQQTRVVKH